MAKNSRTATAAAIKRATLAAHRALEKLDARSRQDVVKVYRQLAAAIGDEIRAAAGANGNVDLSALQHLLGQVNTRLQAAQQARDELLAQHLAEAADLGVRPFTAAAAGEAVVSNPAAIDTANAALSFVRHFVAADGLQLSDRVWRLDRGARDAVVNGIERAVIQGHGAAQAANELLARGQPVPADVSAKVNAADAGRIARDVDSALTTGDGAPMDNALRLFRTEVNRAHGEAYMMSGEKHPDFAGWRYLLSPAHPRPDICDLLSRQNLYGLGGGVYPSRAKTPWPAHPNTLSFIEIVFRDEVSAADQAGKETSLDALARLTPEQRRGALGAHKDEVFEEGKLTTGMIRSPWKSVRSRITSART